MNSLQKYVAECIGTFALVFCGTGAIIINQETGGTVTHAGVAITFGLIVAAMIYTFGDVSGAHFNPAVTIAFWLSCNFPFTQVFYYIVSQLAGALLASCTLSFLFPTNLTLGMTIPHGSEFQSFILELILTFLLMLTIIHVAKGSKEQGMFAGIAIGSVVLLEAMFAGPICGASMNPARSLAPAIICGNLNSIWIYIVAPITGASLAVITWRFIKWQE